MIDLEINCQLFDSVLQSQQFVQTNLGFCGIFCVFVLYKKHVFFSIVIVKLIFVYIKSERANERALYSNRMRQRNRNRERERVFE